MKLRLWQAGRLKRMSKEAFDNLPSGVCFLTITALSPYATGRCTVWFSRSAAGICRVFTSCGR